MLKLAGLATAASIALVFSPTDAVPAAAASNAGALKAPAAAPAARRRPHNPAIKLHPRGHKRCYPSRPPHC